MKPIRTLVLGGVSSGKSAYAEALAENLGARRLYVATAVAGDGEMAAKIAAHQARRGAGWTTLEAAQDLDPVVAAARACDVVLIDCLSMWLANHLLDDADTGARTKALMGLPARLEVPVVMVSNEVGLGGVDPNPLARRFAAELGGLNQAMARLSDRVVLVTAGLPLTLKGAE